MDKISKISSSLFHDKRLKMVNFHGKEILPLYIRIVYNRESAFLKSYYFDLYEQPRYLNRNLTGSKAPSIENIIEKEKELIEFIKGKSTTKFSLELFKEHYKFYSRNILALMEEGFMDYLVTFFQDEGLPAIAGMINSTRSSYRADFIINDLKSLIKPAMYGKLLENAVFYAPPYIPLTSFIKSLKFDLINFMPVYLWDKNEIKEKFEDFLVRKHPEYNTKTTFNYIDKLINL